ERVHDVLPRIEQGQLTLELRRQPEVVVVQEADVPATRDLEAGVARGRSAARRLALDQAHARIGMSRHERCELGRGSVDHDDRLEVVIRLRDEAVERAPKKGEPVQRRRDDADRRHYLRSLFDSMSNHIANSVNCDPEISSRATRTTVPTLTWWPSMRSTSSTIPSTSPARVARKPKP